MSIATLAREHLLEYEETAVALIAQSRMAFNLAWVWVTMYGKGKGWAEVERAMNFRAIAFVLLLTVFFALIGHGSRRSPPRQATLATLHAQRSILGGALQWFAGTLRHVLRSVGERQTARGSNPALESIESPTYGLGLRLFRAQDYVQSYTVLKSVVTSSPNDQRALELYAICGSILGIRESELVPTTQRTPEEGRARIRTARDAAQGLISRAREALSEGDFASSRRCLESASEFLWISTEILSLSEKAELNTLRARVGLSTIESEH